jgi:hypothetical protein
MEVTGTFMLSRIQVPLLSLRDLCVPGAEYFQGFIYR